MIVNLCLDGSFVVKFLSHPCCQMLTQILMDARLATLVLKILYNISSDHKFMKNIIFERLSFQIVPLLSDFKEGVSQQIALALLINLATIDSYASIMAKNGAVRQLTKFAVKTKSHLAFKVLGNISYHQEVTISLKFLDVIEILMKLMIEPSIDQAILSEIIRVIGNLRIPDFNYAKLVTQYDLLSFLQYQFTVGLHNVTHGDILLNSVVLWGTLALDSQVADLSREAGLVDLLKDIIERNPSDKELITQSCYSMYLHFLNSQIQITPGRKI